MLCHSFTVITTSGFGSHLQLSASKSPIFFVSQNVTSFKIMCMCLSTISEFCDDSTVAFCFPFIPRLRWTLHVFLVSENRDVGHLTPSAPYEDEWKTKASLASIPATCQEQLENAANLGKKTQCWLCLNMVWNWDYCQDYYWDILTSRGLSVV